MRDKPDDYTATYHMNDIVSIINNTKQRYITRIEELHQKFEKINKIPNRQFAYKIALGLLTSEYVLNLKNPTISDDIDIIFLWGRKLLEVLIIVKYVLQTDNLKTISEYCDRDRYEYLEGLFARQRADDKLFTYFNMPHDDMSAQKQEMEQIISKYNNKPQKIPSMKKMAEAIDYLDEYDYFYKLSSKMLHFCPFTLNGDTDFNSFIHKTGYIYRGMRYLEEYVKELENIYRAIPKVN